MNEKNTNQNNIVAFSMSRTWTVNSETCWRVLELVCHNSWLMNPEFQFVIHKISSAIPFQSSINQTSNNNTYFFRIYSNIILPFTTR